MLGHARDRLERHAGGPGGGAALTTTIFRIGPTSQALRYLGSGAQRTVEVPVTIGTSRLFQQAPWAYRPPVIRGIAGRISPRHSWLCPGENGLRGMLRAAHGARARGASCVELLLHSSET